MELVDQRGFVKWSDYSQGLGRVLLLAIQVVVVTLDTFSLYFQERLDLRILYDFRHAVVHRPDRATDAAFGDTFLEAVRMQVSVNLRMVFAHWAFHDKPPLTISSRK
jgi:hypothetical protein